MSCVVQIQRFLSKMLKVLTGFFLLLVVKREQSPVCPPVNPVDITILWYLSYYVMCTEFSERPSKVVVQILLRSLVLKRFIFKPWLFPEEPFQKSLLSGQEEKQFLDLISYGKQWENWTKDIKQLFLDIGQQAVWDCDSGDNGNKVSAMIALFCLLEDIFQTLVQAGRILVRV